MNEETALGTKDFIERRLTAIKNQRSTGELEDLALIIGWWLLRALELFVTADISRLDGKSLTFALEKEISKVFLELAMLCKAVVCCTFLVPSIDPWLH